MTVWKSTIFYGLNQGSLCCRWRKVVVATGRVCACVSACEMYDVKIKRTAYVILNGLKRKKSSPSAKPFVCYDQMIRFCKVTLISCNEA